MKLSLGDLVVDKLHERRELIRAKLVQQYKRTKPFRMEEVRPEDQLYNYNQINPEMMTQLRQSMGDEVIDQYIQQMEKLQGRYK